MYFFLNKELKIEARLIGTTIQRFVLDIATLQYFQKKNEKFKYPEFKK